MEVGVRVRARPEEAARLALKAEDGAGSQGTQVASSGWKRPGSHFSPRASEGKQPCQHLDCSLVRLVLDFRPPDL